MMQSPTRVFLRAMAAMKLKSCSELWKKMQAILHGDSGLILHFSKWGCLARSYSLLLDSVRQQVEDHSDSPTTSVVPLSRKLRKLLDAVYEAMEAGARCLQDCTSSCTGSSDHNSWLVGNVIKHGISTEIVHLHLHDLVWCCFLVKQAFGSDVLETMTVRLREIWEDEHEEQDLTSALEFLALLRADGAVLSETTSMAELLSSRLAGASELEGIGPDHLQALPEYLWVPPEELKIDPPKIIGGGAYGDVFEAEWRGGRFAVKTSVYVEEDNCQMEREATILARLRHPNVIHLVCCTKLGEGSRKWALVMELMHKDLGSLLAQKKTGSIPHLVAVDLMLQVAKGMEYLHSLGIVHRDLKSSNILASFPTAKPWFNGKFPRVHLKIADFGMSKAKFPGSEFSTKEIGATRWRAPEVFEDECGEGSQSQYTGKADVYSFALICYEILTRKLPFEGIALRDVGKTVRMGERPELPKYCPLALASYIQRCWHHDPSERPTFTQICRMLRYFKACLFDGDGLLAEGDFANRTCEIVETLLETRYPAQMYPRPTLRIALETNCFETVVEGPEGNDGDDVMCLFSQHGAWSLWSRRRDSLKGRSKRTKLSIGSQPLISQGFRLESCSLHESDSSNVIQATSKRSYTYQELVGATQYFHREITEYAASSTNVPFGVNSETQMQSSSSYASAVYSETQMQSSSSYASAVYSETQMQSSSSYAYPGKEITYQELVGATQDFHREITEYAVASTNVAYCRGCLDDGTEIAVKTINLREYTARSYYEVARELRILCRTEHTNLVPVIGLFRQGADSNRLQIVYEYMPNASLEHIMFHGSAAAVPQALSWERRYQVVLQLAAALKYLHDDSSFAGAVHGDVRPCNIMLDSEWNAKLEYGSKTAFLQDLYSHTLEHTADSAPGIKIEAQGYVAPEFLLSGEATTASDVHSFGVTVLVVACGRKAQARLQNSGGNGAHDLRHWVWQRCQCDEVTNAADEQLGGVFDEVQMRRLLVLGLRCSNADPDARPTMAEVLYMLSEF